METDHPHLQIIWNFWPMDLLVYWPIKASLNIVFFWMWIPSIPFYVVWNIIPESLMLLTWYIDTFLVVVFGQYVFWIGLASLVLGYFYLTALPDCLTWAPVLGTSIFFIRNAVQPNGLIAWFNT